MSKRSGYLPIAVVAVGAFALGAWVFRAPPAATRTHPARTLPANNRTTAATPLAVRPAPLETDGDQHELLAQLRARLPGSLEAVLQALAELGKTNPTLAIDFAHALGRTDREKAAWVTNAMQQWADRDPAAAWQWLRQLTSDRMQELAGGELAGVVLGAMATRDPQMVVSQLDTLLRNGNASEAIATPVAVHVGLAALVEHGKLEVAKAVVEAWAKDPARLILEAAAFEAVATNLAQTQPRESGEWLRSLPASDERNAAFATFVAAWARHDPTSALQWAETLPANEGRHAALQRTVSDWIEEHPQQISGWLGDYLARLPSGPSADRLIETMINNSPTLRAAPQTALQWTNLISDAAKRIDYHETIALRWSEQDSAAALDFVAKSTVIPASRKPAVLQQIQAAAITPRPGG